MVDHRDVARLQPPDHVLRAGIDLGRALDRIGTRPPRLATKGSRDALFPFSHGGGLPFRPRRRPRSAIGGGLPFSHGGGLPFSHGGGFAVADGQELRCACVRATTPPHRRASVTARPPVRRRRRAHGDGAFGGQLLPILRRLHCLLHHDLWCRRTPRPARGASRTSPGVARRVQRADADRDARFTSDPRADFVEHERGGGGEHDARRQHRAESSPLDAARASGRARSPGSGEEEHHGQAPSSVGSAGSISTSMAACGMASSADAPRSPGPTARRQRSAAERPAAASRSRRASRAVVSSSAARLETFQLVETSLGVAARTP